MRLLSLDMTRARLFERIEEILEARRDNLDDGREASREAAQCLEIFRDLVPDWARRCRQVDEKSAELERLRSENTMLRDALRAVVDRLDYLRALWGDEAITRNVADLVRAALEGGGK